MDEFEVIYSKYSPLVFRYLLSLGGDFTSAEEITAETFYRAYINFDKYRGESKIETWLCAIAKNEYFKDCKRKAKTATAEEADRPSNKTDFVEHFMDKEQAVTIYKIVHGLADSYTALRKVQSKSVCKVLPVHLRISRLPCTRAME